MTRSSLISLPHSEPRCEPSQPCTMVGRCARAKCALLEGQEPIDYSTQPWGGTALCDGFYLLQHAVWPSAGRPFTP